MPPPTSGPGPPIVGRPDLALRPPVAGGCRLQPVAVLPLVSTRGDQPLVMVRIDGHMLRMVVDTGAETSVLTPATVAALGLPPGPARTDVRSLGGAAGYGSVRVGRIALGDAVAGGLTLPVMRLGTEAASPAGLIGTDLLRPYQVVFDFPARRLALYRARACAQVDPGGPGTWSRLAWRVATHALPLVTATLDGRAAIALLDTGTAHSAVAAGLVPAAARGDRVVTGYAAGGSALHGSLHQFDRLGLGTVEVAQPQLRVVPLGGLPMEMLIGMDVLRSRRLWLDYPGRRAFLQDAAAP